MTPSDDPTSAEDAELARQLLGAAKDRIDIPECVRRVLYEAAARIEALSRKPQVQVSAEIVQLATTVTDMEAFYGADSVSKGEVKLARELLRVAKEPEGRK